ncbi:MAG: cobalamin-binding protein [Pseudohongiellaceae bacterium]
MMRIVSLLPSATELICSLGLADSLVGVSHECDYPAAVKSLPAVTRSAINPQMTSQEIDQAVRQQLKTEQALYHLRMDVLEALKPDLIVTQALCDVCAVAASEVEAAACALPGQARVINLEPMRLSEVFDTLTLLGEATGISKRAQEVRAQLEHRVQLVSARSATLAEQDKLRVAFLEWIEPLFNAGHWTPELIELAGGVDCLGNKHQPSQSLPDNAIRESAPDVLFIAECGFDETRSAQDLPALSRLPGWPRLPCVVKERLYFCDGNAYFSRPGPRLVDSLELIAHTLYPELHPLPNHLQPAQRFDRRGIPAAG